MASKRAPTPDVRRDLGKELTAAHSLKYQLGQAFAGETDLTLLHDMVEAETELDAAIDAVLHQITIDLANIAGIEIFEAKMAARRERLGNRVDAMRSMLLNALDLLEEKRLERPLATLTRKDKPPKLLITNEAEIPSQYYRTPDPELSKADLTRALKDRRETLEGKLQEIADAIKAGAMTEPEAATATARVIAAFPAIPGAELDNGGVTLQVNWS